MTTTTSLTIGELVGLAFGSPEPGAINFNIIQLVIRSIVKCLAISDIETEFDRKTVADLQHRISDQPLYTTLIPFRDHFSQVEMIDENGGFVSGLLPPRQKSVQLTDEAGMLIKGDRRGSTGTIRTDERSKPTVFKKPLPPIMSFRELELKVSRLEENWAKLHQLKMMRQKHLHEEGEEKGKEEEEMGDLDDIDVLRPPPMSVYEMWQSVQFERKLETNTEGVNKLMSLTQDIIRKLQKMNEPVTVTVAEQQDHVTDHSHEVQLRSSASQHNYDDIQAQLNYLSEMVQQFPAAGTLNNFITWAALDSSLRGDDPVHKILEPEFGLLNFDGKTDLLHDPTKERTSEGGIAHHHKTKGKKHGEVVPSSDQETKKRKSSQGKTIPQVLEAKEKTRKTDVQPEAKRKKSLESRVDKPQIVQKGDIIEGLRQAAASSSGLLGGEAISIGSEEFGSSSSSDVGAESDIVRVESMDQGRQMLTLSPDFLTRLHALGKVNERFDRLEAKLEELEQKNQSEKGGEEMTTMSSSSNVALNTITMQIEAVNKELLSYKETKNELNAVQAQLGSSRMPSMPFSQSILAASGSHPAIEVNDDDGSPEELTTTTTTGETEDGEDGEDEDDGTHQVQFLRVKRSRSVAFDSIEKSMKVIDSTLAVLQRSVKELDDKYKKQLESVNRRLDTVRVDAMESAHALASIHSHADDDDEEEEEEEEKEMKGGLGSRVTYLEKTMIEKQREMGKVQRQMTDLSTEVNNQMEGIMNNFNSFVQNVERNLGMKALSAAAQDDTMNVVYGVQTTFSNVRDEVDKLKSFTIELYNTSNRQQTELDTLGHTADDLKERSELMRRDLEATHDTLDQKVDYDKFEEKCDDLGKSLSNVLSRFVLLDNEWKKMVEKMSVAMKNLIGREEFDLFSGTMISNIHEVAKKLSRLQKQVDELSFLGDDAAAVKRQLFSCLCCDRPVTMTTKPPKPSIPYREALFSRRSTKPFTTYGLEQIRQNARGLVRPRNMSNYERALFERRLTQSSIRDLRSDCANYWRSTPRSNNLVGPRSDGREQLQINTTPRRIVSTGDPNVQDARNDQHPSATSLGSHRSEYAESETNNLLSGFGKVEGGEGGGESSPKIDSTPLSPTEATSVGANEAQQLQTNPSEGKEETSRRPSEPSTPPRHSVLRRGTPAYLGIGLPVRTKAAGRPNSSSISEDDDGSQQTEQRRRSSGGPPPAAGLVKRRGTGFVQNNSLPAGKTSPPSNRWSTGEVIAEDDESPSRRRSSASSGPPPAAGLVKRRGTGFVQNHYLQGKTPPSPNRSSTGEVIAEDDESSSRRRSSASSDGSGRSSQPNFQHLAKRRQTPAVLTQGVPMKAPNAPRSSAPNAARISEPAITEEDGIPQPQPAASSGKERSRPPDNSPASLASRRATPATPAFASAIVGLLPEKMRISLSATAFSIAEEEERIRRQSEVSGGEPLYDKRGSNPSTADHPVQQATTEEVDASAAAAAAESGQLDSDKTIGLGEVKEEDEAPAEDLSQKKPEESSQ